MNMHEWFDLKYEIIYFYNVYGPYQIYNTDMAAVMGVFEDCYNKNLNLPVVKPGTELENLHMLKIQLMHAFTHGNKIKFSLLNF